jgi:hypothetical protein
LDNFFLPEKEERVKKKFRTPGLIGDRVLQDPEPSGNAKIVGRGPRPRRMAVSQCLLVIASDRRERGNLIISQSFI